MRTANFPLPAPRPARTSTLTVNGADVTLEDRDRTRPFLLLHGGGGVATMAGFADLLAERTHSRVLLPTHPGFSGTPRPDRLATVRDLAACYVGLLGQLDLQDVTVIGNSFGGWVAAEIALRGSPRVSGAVIVDGVGIEVPGHPATDIKGMALADVQKLSFYDPGKAPRPRADGTPGPGPDILAMAAYIGPAGLDPTLLDRLGGLDLPAHVIWGEGDGIVDAEYGRAYAAAIPSATFTLLPRTGHLPQVESPEELLGAIVNLS